MASQPPAASGDAAYNDRRETHRVVMQRVGRGLLTRRGVEVAGGAGVMASQPPAASGDAAYTRPPVSRAGRICCLNWLLER